jgi:ribose/xylose/arabinose/galactoside ABC-type transport system permease subunit
MEIIMLIETRIVPLIMSLALLAFLWGILQYIRKGGEPAEREQARQFMLWGIIGLAVMASVWGLVRILTNTIGVPMGIPSLDPIK